MNGTPGAVGGSVRNSAPTVPSFSSSATTGDNRGGFTVVLSGAVRDANTERQLQSLSVAGAGPVAIASGARVVAPAEADASDEPADFDAAGWKVWSGARNDGVLHFQWRHTFAAFQAPGVYSFAATATDKAGATGVSAPVAVTLTAFSDITIAPAPVDAAGAALPGQNWGAWTAEAGATHVESANWLKLVNTGALPGSAVVIDFADAFVGAEDPSFTIPVAGNVQFAWFEDATPAATAPSEGTFAWAAASAEGAVTVTFTGTGNAIYVAYRVAKLPDVLPVQSYGISYTATEL